MPPPGGMTVNSLAAVSLLARSVRRCGGGFAPDLANLAPDLALDLALDLANFDLDLTAEDLPSPPGRRPHGPDHRPAFVPG
ncbi:MAG: hypothetical protein AB8G96_07680 [Phycisphaerales bacterium]